MKIKQFKGGFEPITITIETQMELDQLQGLCNCHILCISIPILNKIRKEVGFRENNYYKTLVDSLVKKIKKD